MSKQQGPTVRRDTASAGRGPTVGRERASAGSGPTVGRERASAGSGPTVGRERASAGSGPTVGRGGAPTANTIDVEIISWVTKFAGGDGTGRRLFAETATEGATVRSVLAGLSRRFPELHAALWHGDEIGEHIEVLVNDAVLGVNHTLDSRVWPGDRIALLGQYMGG